VTHGVGVELVGMTVILQIILDLLYCKLFPDILMFSKATITEVT